MILYTFGHCPVIWVNMDRKKLDEIKTEYITGRLSIKKLAEKYSYSESYLSKESAKGKWKEKRDKYRLKLSEETVKKTVKEKSTTEANRISKQLEQVNLACSSIIKSASHMLTLYDEYDELVSPDELRTLAQALKIATDVLRDSSYTRTTKEQDSYDLAKQKLELERERIEIERLRAQRTGVDTNEDETGVVLLAPVIGGDTDA